MKDIVRANRLLNYLNKYGIDTVNHQSPAIHTISQDDGKIIYAKIYVSFTTIYFLKNIDNSLTRLKNNEPFIKDYSIGHINIIGQYNSFTVEIEIGLGGKSWEE